MTAWIDNCRDWIHRNRWWLIACGVAALVGAIVAGLAHSKLGAPKYAVRP